MAHNNAPFLISCFLLLCYFRFLQDPKEIANSQRFSKMARSKEAMEHSDATVIASSSSPTIHSSPSSSSPSDRSISPSSAATTLPSSTPSMLTSMSSSMSSSTSMPYPSGTVPYTHAHVRHSHMASLHAHHHGDDLGQRSSPHLISAASSTPPPPTAVDDPVAIATHQSMEGVSMMALTSTWTGKGLGSGAEVEGLKVKEEPNSRSNSPAMESWRLHAKKAP